VDFLINVASVDAAAHVFHDHISASPIDEGSTTAMMILSVLVMYPADTSRNPKYVHISQTRIRLFVLLVQCAQPSGFLLGWTTTGIDIGLFLSTELA
jgi:hypothetical protein